MTHYPRGIAGVFSTVGISAERFPAANTTPAADKDRIFFFKPITSSPYIKDTPKRRNRP